MIAPRLTGAAHADRFVPAAEWDLLTIGPSVSDAMIEAMSAGALDVTVTNATRGHVVGDRIRVARSLRDRTVGLLGASRLEAGQGLWIERASSIHMWFMRFPIDAVFVDREGRVTRVVANLAPWRVVWWARGARDCLELPAGAAAGADIRVGDVLVRS